MLVKADGYTNVIIALISAMIKDIICPFVFVFCDTPIIKIWLTCLLLVITYKYLNQNIVYFHSLVSYFVYNIYFGNKREELLESYGFVQVIQVHKYYFIYIVLIDTAKMVLHNITQTCH